MRTAAAASAACGRIRVNPSHPCHASPPCPLDRQSFVVAVPSWISSCESSEPTWETATGIAEAIRGTISRSNIAPRWGDMGFLGLRVGMKKAPQAIRLGALLNRVTTAKPLVRYYPKESGTRSGMGGYGSPAEGDERIAPRNRYAHRPVAQLCRLSALTRSPRQAQGTASRPRLNQTSPLIPTTVSAQTEGSGIGCKTLKD
jgi:hypothetical protein